MGIGFVSSLAIEKSLALGLVKTVAIKELKLNRDFYCVYRSKGVISTPAQRVYRLRQDKDDAKLRQFIIYLMTPRKA